MALGKVQSGKTLSYTSLIALAIDNGYRIIAVLSGTKQTLLEQTYNRLCDDLGANRLSLAAFKNPTPPDLDVIQGVVNQAGSAVLVTLKNPTRLANLRRILGDPELDNYPMLIIDDEGDEASLNTQFRRGRMSAVYRGILELRDELPHHAYVAYTATPQANLLIPIIDGLSPDFGVLLEPGSGYCGGGVFFGQDQDQYVRDIPADEADDEDSQGIPASLRLAIATFLVGAAVRHLREPQGRHAMLIHTAQRRESHRRMHEAVRNLLSLWRSNLTLPSTDPALVELDALFRQGYDDLSRTVEHIPDWASVRQQLPNELAVEVWLVNSLPVGSDPIRTSFRLRNNILVGGNMLGRGVTIDGLAVSYITRRARTETNADTLEQRARWFGYKESYLDLCRIFLPPQLRRDYTELLQHEDDFWDALRRNERQGLSIREWPRMFSLDISMGLRPTRSSVASYRQFRGQGWDVQQIVVEDPVRAQQNVAHVVRFFSVHRPQAHQFGNVEHHLLANCDTTVVVHDLLGRLDMDGTDWEATYTNEFLTRLFVAGALPNLDVLLMSGGRPRRRTKLDNGRINPMQGRSPGRSLDDPEYYPGDSGLHGNRVQLQVHIIRLEVPDAPNSLETTALALYVPADNAHYDLHYVVGSP
ncbi:Z1 domain-containing protein [Limnochorda pilosa]|uniref:Z1 domain-containing protein n=1 Tax=Limnochorda pilosa TaxID=1555112 RepID=UPI00130E6EEE|nr:Z1 domain-containing protein [Limnochorda pilosa]